ncbi:hypothetical protein Taro_036991 [Colocasia esculenta]|uniref:Uncharacterized protein n=1 Tax=Colocasia esculenta TaxID=4460 RepID=A0A843WEZ2_COLES|nr:hypothetical protein [Colocasia esculenta]
MDLYHVGPNLKRVVSPFWVPAALLKWRRPDLSRSQKGHDGPDRRIMNATSRAVAVFAQTVNPARFNRTRPAPVSRLETTGESDGDYHTHEEGNEDDAQE